MRAIPDEPEKFKVAFSFAGEQRDLVEKIVTALEARLGEGTVFYDNWFEHLIAGSDGYSVLQQIYLRRSHLVVQCVSKEWDTKPWTKVECRAIQALEMELDSSRRKEDRYRILPLRVGDGELEGVLSSTIVPDIRNKPVEETVNLIVNRLNLVLKNPISKDIPRVVYLAECTADLEEKRANLQAFLEDRRWEVLPKNDAEPSSDAPSPDDLKQSLAFIQLLGPYPWKRGSYDRVQYAAATAAGMPNLRWCNPDIDMEEVRKRSPEHYDFLSADDVRTRGFEDFKMLVEKELELLWQQKRKIDRSIDECKDDEQCFLKFPYLIHVIVRSKDPDMLWEKVFQWIDEQGDLLPYQLEMSETLRTRHEAEPCQGFMVVCDHTAHEDGPMSTRQDLGQCREIQMKKKDGRRCPPVGVVYWPPPSPSWPRLLRCAPLKLHRIDGTKPNGELTQFFADVRATHR